MSYTIEKISKIIKAQYVGSAPDVKILRLLTDSRSLSFPDETLFFAIVTRHGDGHNYVDELYRRGVRNFVVNSAFDCSRFPDAGFLVVKDTLQSLQLLAAHHRGSYDIPVVGITGSDGKT
ncbi:MAG: bifunctional UDP-N-acetylmuramoyl-tripeptide:D-alanyl-D-alanine ligase/alanine racemase, partial [Bacteroidaceae bacterium]|nr:bifunctional UDP-N-acetylmuramoyl-tripeptide:D-alanyl-D-alanine ligase/alanine racemase [Bacteroidaceae bacterium]